MTSPADLIKGLTVDQLKAKAKEMDAELAAAKELTLSLRGKQDKMDEYTAAFKRMSEIDAQSLIYLLAAVREEIHSAKVEAKPVPMTPAPSAEFKQRAVSALYASLIADAASVGVEWIYDMGEVGRLADQHKGDLTFVEPVASPWLKADVYSSGALSPYGTCRAYACTTSTQLSLSISPSLLPLHTLHNEHRRAATHADQVDV